MRIRKSDWTLLAAWLVFIVFGGPFAMSARDWFLVAAGFAVLAGLIYFTAKAVKFHMGATKSA
jgi:hypothetical protein